MLHAELKVDPVELEISGPGERWISVKALREIEHPTAPKQRLLVQPEGVAKVNVPAELDKLFPSMHVQRWAIPDGWSAPTYLCRLCPG